MHAKRILTGLWRGCLGWGVAWLILSAVSGQSGDGFGEARFPNGQALQERIEMGHSQLPVVASRAERAVMGDLTDRHEKP